MRLLRHVLFGASLLAIVILVIFVQERWFPIREGSTLPGVFATAVATIAVVGWLAAANTLWFLSCELARWQLEPLTILRVAFLALRKPWLLWAEDVGIPQMIACFSARDLERGQAQAKEYFEAKARLAKATRAGKHKKAGQKVAVCSNCDDLVILPKEPDEVQVICPGCARLYFFDGFAWSNAGGQLEECEEEGVAS